jgi:hypothetical protein
MAALELARLAAYDLRKLAFPISDLFGRDLR